MTTRATLRVAAVAVGIGVLAAGGCGQDSPTEMRTGAGPSEEFGEYQPLDLGLESTLRPSVAVGNGHLLVLGGLRRSGDGWEVVSSGTLVDLATGAEASVPPWPSGGARYAPAIVWSGEEFIVLGADCPSVSPVEDEVNCDAPVEAAAYSPTTGAWRPLQLDASMLSSPGPSAVAYGFSQGRALFAVGSATAELVGVDPRDGSATAYGAIPPSEEAWTCFTGDRLGRFVVEAGDSRLESSLLDAASGIFEPMSDVELDPHDGPPDFVDCPGAPILYSAENGVTLVRWLSADAASWVEVPPLELTDAACCPEVARLGDTLVVWPGLGAGPSVLGEGSDAWEPLDAPDIRPRELLATPNALVVISPVGAPREGTEIGLIRVG